MLNILLVIQIIVALSIVIIVLLQRNASDGLSGLSGSSNNLNSVMSGRASANALTKLTTILGGIFMLNCLVMGALTAKEHNFELKVGDQIEQTIDNVDEGNLDNNDNTSLPVVPLEE